MLKRLLPKEFRATLAWLLCVHALGLLLLSLLRLAGWLALRGLSGGGGAGRIGDVGHDGSLTHGGRGDPVCRRCGWVILLMSETH